MSLWTKIEAAFKKIFGSTKWEQTAEAVLSVVGPLLTTILTLTAGAPAAAAASGIIAKVQTAIAAAQKVSTDVQNGLVSSANGAAQVSSLIQTVQADLPTILEAAQIKDPTTLAKVTGIVDSITESLAGLLAAVGESAQTPPPAAPPATA